MKNIIFFVIFLVVVVVGGLLISASFYKDSVSIAEKAAKTELQMITSAVSNDLNYIFSSSGRDLKLVASFFKTEEIPTKQELSEIFSKYFKTNSFLMNFWFNDKNGIRKITVPKKFNAENGNDYSFREYFKNAEKYRKSVYSEVLSNYRAKGTEQKFDSIVIATPIFDKDNNFFGILGTDIDVKKIEERIQTQYLTKAPTKSGLYCVDFLNSRIIAGPQEQVITPEFKKNIVEISGSDDFKNIDGVIKTNLGKGKYFVAGSLIKNPAYSFNLIGIFPYDETMAYIPHFFKQIKWLMVFILVVVIMALFIVVYNQTIFKMLRKRIKTLEINVSEHQKQKAVDELVESDYFKKLQSKVKEIKKIKKA